LLQTGRAYGLVVGLSPVLGGEMVRRHGEAAAPVLANVWRVDPASNINCIEVSRPNPPTT
jgi:hypothetical protein